MPAVKTTPCAARWSLFSPRTRVWPRTSWNNQPPRRSHRRRSRHCLTSQVRSSSRKPSIAATRSSARSRAGAWPPCMPRATCGTIGASPSRSCATRSRRPSAPSAFSKRSASPPCYSTRTSYRCSTLAALTVCSGTSCRSSTARHCARGSRAKGAYLSARRCGSRTRWRMHSTMRTRGASYTATSSPRTFSCSKATRSSPTSASRWRWRTRAATG